MGPGLVVDLGGTQAADTEFPYRVPIVDRGTIAAPLFLSVNSPALILSKNSGVFLAKIG